MKNFFLLLIFSFVCSVTIFMIYQAIHYTYIKNARLLSPIVAMVAAPFIETQHEKLQEIVAASLSGTTGTYSVVIKNLKTGVTTSVNEHHSYEAASLYKLWVMAAAMKQIQNGTLTEEQVLHEAIPVLNEKFDLASESAELTEGEISLPVNTALNQMVTISHNYAALLLTEKIRLSSVATFLKENNLSESSIGQPPQTTAQDIAIFLEKLYIGELADAPHTQEMLKLMKEQRLNNKLPKYLPPDVVVAHKTGELGSFSHDAGIVYTNKGDYVIVVLSDSDYPPGAVERIADLSKAVYEYFDEES